MKPLELEENLKKYTRIAECPVRNVISRFSGKWSMLILSVPVSYTHLTLPTKLGV